MLCYDVMFFMTLMLSVGLSIMFMLTMSPDSISQSPHHFAGMTGLQGPVRRIHFAPAAASELTHNLSIANPAQPPHTARVAALFSTGAFAVWELPPSYELRPVRSSLRPAGGCQCCLCEEFFGTEVYC